MSLFLPLAWMETDRGFTTVAAHPHSTTERAIITLCVVYHLTANGQPKNVVLSNHIRSDLDRLRSYETT